MFGLFLYINIKDKFSKRGLPMFTAKSIIDFVEQLTGHPIYDDNDQGVCYGSADREAKRLVVCWMPTVDALEYAGEQKADVVLTHESLFYPYGSLLQKGKVQPWESWRINVERKKLLDKYDLTILRIHGSLDEICIFDEFVKLLKLGEPVKTETSWQCYEDRWGKIFAIKPQPLSQLIDYVKRCADMKLVRVAAPKGMDQVVNRIGLPWGGMGISRNAVYMAKLIDMGCDVLIAGEADNYGARFAAECGIPVIETDHEISENPGIRRFTEMLKKHFPDIEISFFECGPVWQAL